MPAFLIADDSPNKIALLTAMLHRAGWKEPILHAETTEDAIRLIDEGDIGYAFVDYYMPSAHGPAVIAHLKEKNPAARIALVSSSDNSENAEEAHRAGAEASICTSWPADEVESAILGRVGEWMEEAASTKMTRADVARA
jgi:DNA-binding NarL/FixJ family response regulator